MTYPNSSLPTAGGVDSDVHPRFRHGVQSLAPYLDEKWFAHLSAGRMETRGDTATASYSMPSTHYINLGGTDRYDAITPSGGPPASEPEYAASELLDRHQLGAAVLLGGDMLGLGGVANADWAAALASAYNDWMCDVWLAADSRWKGALVVASQDPAKAAEEIARLADHPGIVSVFIPNANVLLGKRTMYPIYEAAQHYGLPVTVHPGGSGAGKNSEMLPVQAPSFYSEYNSMIATIFIGHLCSLILEGTFEMFPALKVGLIEAGFAWLPHFQWRLDANWRGLRTETPWVKRLPSEYIREHIRVTSQPMYEPERNSQLLEMLEMIHADEMLMFSTDYPHWDGDEPERILKRLPDDLVRKMVHDTPRSFYAKLGSGDRSAVLKV